MLGSMPSCSPVFPGTKIVSKTQQLAYSTITNTTTLGTDKNEAHCPRQNIRDNKHRSEGVSMSYHLYSNDSFLTIS